MTLGVPHKQTTEWQQEKPHTKVTSHKLFKLSLTHLIHSPPQDNNSCSSSTSVAVSVGSLMHLCLEGFPWPVLISTSSPRHLEKFGLFTPLLVKEVGLCPVKLSCCRAVYVNTLLMFPHVFPDKSRVAVAQQVEQVARVTGRLLVQIPAPVWAVLHVKVSLSKILDPRLLLMCSWHLAWRPLPSVRALRWAGDSPSPRDSWDWLQQKPLWPHKRDKAVTHNGWMDYFFLRKWPLEGELSVPPFRYLVEHQTLASNKWYQLTKTHCRT